VYATISFPTVHKTEVISVWVTEEQKEVTLRTTVGGQQPQGADPSLPPLHVATAGKNYLNEEITPLLPTGIGREDHIRTCSALAPMWIPPINQSAELTQGSL
jgi:hypothetical protein